MLINKTDITKYSFGEQFSDMNGKTSNAAVIGAYLCFIGGLCFLLGTISFLFWKSHIGFETILLQSLALTTLGTSLIITKRFKQTNDTTNTDVSENGNN